MRTRRKLAVGIAAALGTILILLLVLPFLFRDRIAARVKTELAKSVNAQVSWSGVGLSLLRDFPNVTFRLNDLTIRGLKPFAGDTLLAMRQLRVVFDVGSVIRNLRHGDAIVVREVNMERPAARLLVLADGNENWNIVRKQPRGATTDTSTALAVSLRQFAIHDGSIRYDDRHANSTAAVSGLELALNGDFAQDSFNLATRVGADSVSYHFAGIPYLSDVALALDAKVGADMRHRRFTFAQDTLHLNDLVLAFAGSVGLGDSTTALDLTFSSPGTAFASILSLVPAIYARDFRSLQTSGRMSVAGRVHGNYGAHTVPAFALKATVENGAFRYPDLPLPARDIALDLAVDNPGGSIDSTVVALNRFHVALGQRPLDARLVLRTPVSDPDIDVTLKGSVDLADVQRAVKLPDVKQLTGLITADLAVHTRKSWVDAGTYDRIAAKGSFGVSRLALNSAAVPRPIAIDSARLAFTPRHAELSSFAARIGNSDISATGTLDNVLGFVLHDDELRGDATVASHRFDLNEWRSRDKSKVIAVPPRVDFTLHATVKQLLYGQLDIANARGAVRVKDQRVTFDGFRMDMLGGEVTASGFYETTTPARPTFNLAVTVDSLDIPTAFSKLVTVQQLAPVARYTHGVLNAQLDLTGPLAEDMMPVFSALTGQGSFRTGSVAIQGFPVLVKLADVLKMDQLRNPTLQPLADKFRIENGRLTVQPFDAHIGDLAVTVSGSNGIDRTLDYNLALAVPTKMLGSGANQAISSLASSAGRAGINLGSAAVVSIGARVTGTVTDPVIRPSFAGTAGSVKEAVQQAVQTKVESTVTNVKQRVDSAQQAVQRVARARADSLVAQAQQQAAVLRQQADSLAARVKREADAKATAMVAQANNPALKIVAQAGADKLRQQADQQAQKLVQDATARGDSLIAAAQRQGQALTTPQP